MRGPPITSPLFGTASEVRKELKLSANHDHNWEEKKRKMISCQFGRLNQVFNLSLKQLVRQPGI